MLPLELNHVVKVSYTHDFKTHYGIVEIIGIDTKQKNIQFIAKVIFPNKHKNLHLISDECELIKNFGKITLGELSENYPEYLI